MTPSAGGPLGGWLRAQRQARGWDVAEMGRRLRKAAAGGGGTLPEDASLESSIRRWERGAVAPSERYKLLYCAAFGIRAGQYGQVLPPAPPGQDGQVRPQAPAGAGPARPLTQPGPETAAGGDPPLCLSRLVRLVAQAVIDGVTCQCVAYGTPARQAVPAGRPEGEDPAGQLIAAAYQRGCDIDAIAAVCGMSRPEVRGVLKQAGTGAWT